MPASRTCDYCGDEIEPGTGTMFVRTDGSTVHYCSAKCEKNADLGREPRDVEWTEAGQSSTEAEAAAEEAEAPEAEETAEEEPEAEEPETDAPEPDEESNETETETAGDDEPDEPEDDEE